MLNVFMYRAVALVDMLRCAAVQQACVNGSLLSLLNENVARSAGKPLAQPGQQRFVCAATLHAAV